MLPDPVAGTAVPQPPTSRDVLSTPVRQSPVALVFIAWRFVKQIGLVNIGAALIFTVTGGLPSLLWLAATAVAAGILVFSALSWWRFTFVVIDDEMVVTKGILSVERLVIPLDRVQSVSIDQRLLHRIVGLVSASVDTAGSADTEFEIAAIDAATAESLRLVASDARSAAQRRADADESTPATPTPDRVLLQRTFGELALVGVTRLPWTGLAVLAPLVALSDEFDRFTTLGDRVEELVDGRLGSGSTGGVIVFASILVLLATLFGALLQMVREIVTNWKLTLYRTPTGLRRTAGLLSTTSRSSTLRRVQAITTDDTPPQRWLGITTLTLRTFGENDIHLPGSRLADVARMRELVFGAVAPPLDRMISRWYVFLATRTAALVALAAAVLLWFQIGWWAATVLAIVPIRWAAARRQWRRRRWGIDGAGIAESYELLTRHTAEAPLVKAQVVKVTQSFFERRRGLATVRIQTADGFLAVPLIDLAEAMAVRDRTLFSVETDRRPIL